MLAWTAVVLGTTIPAGAQLPSADIALDGSLGSTDPVPVTIGPSGGRHYRIPDSLGAFMGENLFHSFRIFGIPRGGSATFLSDASPSRVIARVTGGERSVIEGALRSEISGADLYLLNPSGVSLREGASIQMLDGSLFVSTADLLRFDDGSDPYDARDSSPNPTLTAAAPAAFGFLGDDPHRIELARPEGLSAPPGHTLSFVGADQPVSEITTLPGVEFTGVVFGVPVVSAPGATLQLAAAGADAAVDIPVDLSRLDPAEAEPGALGSVVIGPNAIVRMNSLGETPAGEIVIRGGRFVLDRSSLDARNGADADAIGPIDIAARDSIEMGPGFALTTWAAGKGSAGGISLSAGEVTAIGDDTGSAQIRSFATHDTAGAPIEIEADEVTLVGNAQLTTLSRNEGDGGAIVVTANRLELRGGATVQSIAEGTGGDAGTGGAIHLDSKVLVVHSGATILSRADSGGDGGAIEIRGESVLVDNTNGPADGTRISNIAGKSVESRPEGEEVRGGDIAIHVETLKLVEGGQIFTSTEGAGEAGTLSILGADTVRITGVDTNENPSGLTTRALQNATGRGGLLEIDTRALFVEDGGQVSSATFGLSNAGEVRIDATERIVVDGGSNGFSVISSASLVSASNPVVVGDGSNLTITTSSLELTDGGQITASASGTGNAGDVLIQARNVEIEGAGGEGSANASGIFSRSNTEGVPQGGAGGSLTILAEGDVRLSDRGQVSVSTSGGGDAGRILIQAGGAVELGTGASISALSVDPGSGGDGGAIDVYGKRVVLRGGSEITARSQGTGAAGNVEIRAVNRFDSVDSAVTTEATRSSGGLVTIIAGESLYLNGVGVETNVLDGSGGGGDVDLEARFVTLDGGRVIASADEGAGGNILISSSTFLSSAPLIVNDAVRIDGIGRTSLIDATSRTDGLSGRVEIKAPDTDLIGKLEPLPSEFLDATALLTSSCAARTQRTGSFTVVGREALPVPPDSELPPSGVVPSRPIGDCPLGEEIR
jgi:filamentous hemagglutinin family protein